MTPFGELKVKGMKLKLSLMNADRKLDLLQ